MLASVDLRILSDIRSNGASITEIADAIEYDKSYVSRRVSYLESVELLSRERDAGGTQYVTRQTNAVTAAYDEAVDELGAADLPELLSPSTLEVVWALRTPIAVKRIVPHLTLSRVRVHQILKTLRQRQLVSQHDGRYELKPAYRSLRSFATELARHLQQVYVQEAVPDSTVVWAGPFEALVVPGEQTSESQLDELLDDGATTREPTHPGSGVEAASWHLTGLVSFREYGLEFLHAGQPLLYKVAPELDATLDIEHHIVHTLKRRVDDRRGSYCAMLALEAIVDERLDVTYLQTLADEYEIGDVVAHLLRYVAAAGAYEPPEDLRPQLPTWEQIEETAEQYDVALKSGSSELAKVMGLPRRTDQEERSEER